MSRAAQAQPTEPTVGGVAAAARLALVDALRSERDATACASLTLRWLADQAGVLRGMCAVVDDGSENLWGLAGHGLPTPEVASFEVEITRPGHPLAIALGSVEPVPFNLVDGRPLLDTPLGAEPFWTVALPHPAVAGDAGRGLLLLAGTATMDDAGRQLVVWAADVLGIRLDALGYLRMLAEERRHRHQLARLTAVIEAVTDPIILSDDEGRILIANRGAEELLAADERMSEGRRRAVALNNMLFSASVIGEGGDHSGSTRRELLLVDPVDGQDLMFEVLVSAIETRPGEKGAVSILRNVTDLHRATEELEANYRKLRMAEAKTRAERDRLDLILNSVADPVLVTDLGGSIVLMNPPAERLFTSEGDDEQTERRVRANDAVFTSSVSNVLAGPSSGWRGELALIDPETGATVPVEAIAGKVASRHGQDTAVVTILHDLTEAKEKAALYEQVKRHSEELQDKIREATRELADQNELLRRQALELEEASALKSQFLANVSHELRTPLNAIIGYTQLLLDGVAGAVTPPQREKLDRLDSNANHLLAIINDLLDIARIEAGKIPLQLEQFRLAELVEEVMAEAEPLIAMSNLDVRHAVAAAIGVVHSDRQKVKQIIINLLSNALKFTPAGSISIRAEWRLDGDMIAVAVTDTGVGISRESQKTVFEAFGQSASSYSRRQGGTGLGLSICRRLATLLGGTIELESAPGAGSTFTLLLPPTIPETP